MPVQISGAITVGATGAVSSVQGKGVVSATRLATGQYQVLLQDNFNSLIFFDAHMRSPPSGTPVSGGSFSVGTVYQIITLGTTTQAQWVAAGVPKQVTAAPGVIFKAATVGAGTGTVNTLGVSGINLIEGAGLAAAEIAPNPAIQVGAIMSLQTLGATSTSVTTLIPKDPASGSLIAFRFILNNSSVP